jgi:protein TonB
MRSDNHKQLLGNVVLLTGVVVVHVLGFIWAAQNFNTPSSTSPPYSIEGVLIAQTPLPAQVVPKEAQKPKPALAPKNTPVTPTREVALEPTTPLAPSALSPVEPNPASTTVPSITSTTSPSPTPAPVSAPVTLPRSHAAHLNNPHPPYPALSRRLGEEGQVLLEVYILPNGSVGDIKLKQSSGFSRLDNAALEAVRKWQFIPAKRGDNAFATWTIQPISFVLN